MLFSAKNMLVRETHGVVKQLDQKEKELGVNNVELVGEVEHLIKRIAFSSMSFCQPIFTNTKHVGDLLKNQHVAILLETLLLHVDDTIPMQQH